MRESIFNPCDMCEQKCCDKCLFHSLAKKVVRPTIDPSTLRPKGEWISVEDRLPKPETDVIVFGGGFIDILTYRYDRRGNICFMYQDECGYWTERFSPPVTHWMPLPEPPDTED